MQDRAAVSAIPAAAPVDEGEEVNAALAELMPQMRGILITGWAVVAGLLAVALILAINLPSTSENAFQFLALGAIGCVVLAFYAGHWTRRRHEALVLPVLARSAGLSYEQGASYYTESLPRRMLPRGSVRKCEDLVQGKVAGRQIAFGEVKIETGGKNSTVLFKGVVARYAHLVPMPPFLIAAEKETRGWFIFKGNIQVDDLSYIRTIPGRADSYGVWSHKYKVADEPGFEALLAAIFKVERVLDHDSHLYSASSDGRTTHVAIRHKRDLFRLGGLFSTRDNIETQIRAAHHDLLIPIKVVQVLLDAEALALSESRESAGAAAGLAGQTSPG